MRLIITGATGLLGRNLVFEFIRKHIDAPGDLRIIALGRPSGNIALQDRLRNIVLTDGADYTGIERPALGRFFDERVSCVHADLDAQDLALTPQDRRALKRRPIDLFIHAAALTDLRAAPSVARTLHHTNVEGTRGVLKLVSELDVEEFFYIGSAYCAGAVHGTVAPDSRCADSEFRNPYERTKLEAEEVTREYARQTGLSCRTFRPSVICGRLMAPPIGATCKFDTFYVLGAFLLWLKSRITGGSADIHRGPVSADLRIAGNPLGSLNIVPADFAAKAICAVHAHGGTERSYHVSNPVPTPHMAYTIEILKALNMRGVRPVMSVPANPNRFEAMYFRTVGSVFNPYITGPSTLFDTSSLAPALAAAGLRCPRVAGDNLRALIRYAAERDFGMRPDPGGPKGPPTADDSVQMEAE